MRFVIKGIKLDGRIDTLALNALDESSARHEAEGRGYAVLSVNRHAELSALWRVRGERFPVLLFSQELLVLLSSGLPLVVAIETLAEKERHAGVRSILEHIAGTLRQGHTLSTALQRHPGAFSPLYVATVLASERTSDLTQTLGRYIAYQNQVDAIRKRLINASIYPALLILAGGW